MTGAAFDPLMGTSRPDQYWTRSNVGEAVPGVMTPLNWSLWGTVGERTVRGGVHALGAISGREAQPATDEADRILKVFHGRLAVSADFMALIGDRLPGMTGEQAVSGIFGRVPEGMTFHPTRRRYPFVAGRLTRNFVRYPRELAALTDRFDRWWEQGTARAEHLDHAGAVDLFTEAVARLADSIGRRNTT